MIARLMAILQGPSGEPKDRYVNNFHFGVPNNEPEGWQFTAKQAVDAFYAELNDWIPGALTREEYRIYNLSDPMPREPHYEAPGSQPTGSGAALPFEVAACLSYYSERNIRRRRGRVYIGPLVTSALATVGGRIDPVVNPDLRADMLSAAEQLQAIAWGSGGGGSITMPWGVYSPTMGQVNAITDAWVDNAFDTQRRRGTVAVDRVTTSTIPD